MSISNHTWVIFENSLIFSSALFWGLTGTCSALAEVLIEDDELYSISLSIELVYHSWHDPIFSSHIFSYMVHCYDELASLLLCYV